MLDPDPETQLDRVENWWKSLSVISSRVPDEQVQRTEEKQKMGDSSLRRLNLASFSLLSFYSIVTNWKPTILYTRAIPRPDRGHHSTDYRGQDN